MLRFHCIFQEFGFIVVSQGSEHKAEVVRMCCYCTPADLKLVRAHHKRNAALERERQL